MAANELAASERRASVSGAADGTSPEVSDASAGNQCPQVMEDEEHIEAVR